MKKKKKEETMKCKHCGFKMETKSRYCPECGTKKSASILLFFLIMVPLFLCVFFTANSSSLFYEIISGFKYGKEFIIETMLSFVVLIVILISGNSYIFTQKKDNIFKSILNGWPMILVSCTSLLASVMSIIISKNIEFTIVFNIFNLILYCIAIGTFEEFLCRGWLFNEFIERFGHTKKQVALSIILSSLIFGGVHFINFFSTSQGLVITIAQIVQASSIGIFLASLYYKNKNIWSVVFLHAFYDFAIFLSEANLIKDCTTGTLSNGVIIYFAISSVIVALFFMLASVITLRKSERWNNLPSLSENKKKKNVLLYIAFGISVVFMYLPTANLFEGIEDYQVCYTFEGKTLDNYKIIKINYSKFNFKHSRITEVKPSTTLNGVQTLPISKTELFDFTIKWDDTDIVIVNETNKEKYTLNEKDEYPVDLIAFEDNNRIVIAYEIVDVSGSIINYFVMDKNNMTNTNEYLESVKKAKKTYELTILRNLGYIETEDNQRYFYTDDGLSNEFIIDNKDKLFVLKYE